MQQLYGAVTYENVKYFCSYDLSRSFFYGCNRPATESMALSLFIEQLKGVFMSGKRKDQRINKLRIKFTSLLCAK